MKKKFIIIISIVLLVSMLSVLLVGCSKKDIKDIIKVKSFEEISKIQIVHNTDYVDGVVKGSEVIDYTSDNDIMNIYNIISKAEYIEEKEDISKLPRYSVRIYLKDTKGYIEYNWDKSFVACDGFDGKIKEGFYSMVDADVAEKQIEDIFYGK